MSVVTWSWFEEKGPRDVARWIAAAAVVLIVHGAAAAFLLSWHQLQDIGDDSDIVTVELAPIDSTPESITHDMAQSPETMIESKTVPQVEKELTNEAVRIEQSPDRSRVLVPLQETQAPDEIKTALPPAPRTAESGKGGAPRIEPSWQTSLVRKIQGAKRYPPAARARGEQGVVLLRFSLDRNGHLLTHSITQSSGHADLDEEVMAMIVRAEPLPPFPPSMSQPRLDLTVPIRFSLQ